MYDYVIVTHLPAFYKTNLYNALAKKLKIYVIFIAEQSIQRSPDFINLDCQFEYKILNDGSFEKRSVLNSIFKLRDVMQQLAYKRVIVNGWDLYEFWWLVFTNGPSKNCLALESTVIESNADGLRKVIKKLFLSRISKVFASGKLHQQLLNKLNYSGEIKITKGVGLINKSEKSTFSDRKVYKNKFLYLGRLSPEKNVSLLISVFNNLPNYYLSIVGSGCLKFELEQQRVKDNIMFLDHVDNTKLQGIFEQHDFLILPSLSEPWGLVVEEALFFGIPVIISENCGSVELIKDSENGFVFSPSDKNQLKEIILKIDDKTYHQMLMNINDSDIFDKDVQQTQAYL